MTMTKSVSSNQYDGVYRLGLLVRAYRLANEVMP